MSDVGALLMVLRCGRGRKEWYAAEERTDNFGGCNRAWVQWKKVGYTLADR